MDDTVLPLDLTIYGAIHQYELRKKTIPSIPPNMVWQGIYTVKFKKVTGPASSPESRRLVLLPFYMSLTMNLYSSR
jgi:E3 ubiquitin-protein ligase TRIP12